MKIKRFCSSRGSKSFHCVHRGRRSALILVNSCGFGQSVLTAFSYLTTINRSLLNVPMSHFLLSCHTCSIYRPFNHLLIFQQTLTRFSLIPVESVVFHRIQFSGEIGKVQYVLEEGCLDQHLERACQTHATSSAEVSHLPPLISLWPPFPPFLNLPPPTMSPSFYPRSIFL